MINASAKLSEVGEVLHQVERAENIKKKKELKVEYIENNKLM